MSVSTAVSRITGFVRTWATAYALGVTALAASYSVANNIPNMVFELLAGGVLSAVFIPLFIERRQEEGDAGAWRFASSATNLVALVLGAVALVATIWPEPLVRTQTFRISAEQAEMATYFFRFFAVQIVFYGVGGVMSGALNSYRRFLAPAMAPIFNNLVVIVTLLGFYVPFRESDPALAKAGLAIGTTLGVVVMTLFLVPSLIRVGARYSFVIDLRHPAVRKMLRKAVPIVIYVATNLVSVSFRNAYAFQVSTDGPAALLYAWMFYQLPYGVLAVALATAIFPELSDKADSRQWAAYREIFSKGLRATAMLILPMAALLVALSREVTSLYRAGSFTADDVPRVASILVWWAVGLFFYASFMFTLRAFYAMQDTRTPMITNLGLTVLQVFLYATLTSGMGAIPALGLRGIPIADAVFFSVHLVVLLALLRRRVGLHDGRGIAYAVVRIAIASTAGGAVAAGIARLLASVAEAPAGAVLQVAVAGIFGLATAFGASAVLGVREVRIARDLVGRAFGRRHAEAGE